VAPDIRRFLRAWFLTILGWIVLLGAGFVVNVLITDRLDNEPLRWVANAASLFGSIKLGLMLHDWVFSRADPQGRLRAEAAKLGADAED
jgi:hypothetical protein